MTRFTGEAAYKQIIDDLRAKIYEGTLKPGEQLPSIAELMREHGVSLTVVKAALAELKTTGEIYGHQGKGTFVQNTPRGRRVRRIPHAGGKVEGSTFAAEMRSLGLEPRTELVQVEEIQPPADIADRLELHDNERVLVRKRHMFGSDQPVQLATAYVPMKVAKSVDIAWPDTGPTGMYARLGERGHRPVRFVEEIDVRHPKPEERAFLEPPPGLPVFVVTRVAYDADDVAVEAATNVLIANRWSLFYEWREDAEA